MAIDYPALRAELETDPNGYGYAPLLAAGADQGLADLLNEERANITVRRPDITAAEVLEAIDNRDFVATPNAAHVAWFGSVTRQESVRLVTDAGVDTRILGGLRRLLDNADTQGSRARLGAIANRLGSRAEQLFGAGTLVRHEDVTKARVA